MGYCPRFTVMVLIVEYWEFSVTIRPSTMPGRTQIAMGSYTCYVRLLFPIVGSKWCVLRALRMSWTIVIFHYNTLMYISSTSIYSKYEVICRWISLSSPILIRTN